MVDFVLNFQNILEYLENQGIETDIKPEQTEISLISAKNFNLLVSLDDNNKLLVKQERKIQGGKTAGEFLSEWRLQEFLRQFSQLEDLRELAPNVFYFDPENSIIIAKYLPEYRDLLDFYIKENNFPKIIVQDLGNALAKIHQKTFNNVQYQEFFQVSSTADTAETVHPCMGLIRGLERMTPEVFASVPADGLKFFVLYQRFDSLGQAIAELGSAFTPACLTHNDLKLNNILLHQDWPTIERPSIRLIDWERSSWGDPAFDLGTLLGSYLQLWLGSLIISSALSIEESLRLATIPLESLQPSMSNLVLAYLDSFPEIVRLRPDFIKRVVQFAGFSLIQQIQAKIQYQKSFGNGGIALLQVAKALLCRPESSMPTLFGSASQQLNSHAGIVPVGV